MQEDHVSMGWGAARKLRTVVANLRRILAVELTCAGRGIELRAPLAPAAGTGAALGALRAGRRGRRAGSLALAGAGRGRRSCFADGTLLAAVDAAVGGLE